MSSTFTPQGRGQLLPALPVSIPYYANQNDAFFTQLDPTSTPLANEQVYTASGAFVDVVLAVSCLVQASNAVANRVMLLRLTDASGAVLYQASSPQVQTSGQSVFYSWAWGVSSTLPSDVSVTMPLFPVPLLAGMSVVVSISHADAADTFASNTRWTVLRFATNAPLAALEQAVAAPTTTPILV